MTTDTFDPEAALRRGDDEDENKGSGGNFRKERHWDLKEGEEGILRFLLESHEWYRARTHRFFPTKAKPDDHEGNWPSVMPATCREEPAFAQLYPKGCPICQSGWKNKYGKENKGDDLRYTLAVEREQYIDEATKKKAYRDKMVDVPILDDEGKPTEEKVTVPSVVIVSNTMYMLMNALKASGEAYDNTLRDRDYRIKRVKNPSGNGTIYQVFPIDKDPAIEPGTEHWEFYELAVEALGIKLATQIYNKTTDEYYNRFFLEEDGFCSVDVRRETGELAPARKEKGGSSGGSTPSGSAPATPNKASLAAMKERISKQ